jgi:hypothetical protein
MFGRFEDKGCPVFLTALLYTPAGLQSVNRPAFLEVWQKYVQSPYNKIN